MVRQRFQTARVDMRVSPEQKQALHAMAAETGETATELILRLLDAEYHKLEALRDEQKSVQ